MNYIPSQFSEFYKKLEDFLTFSKKININSIKIDKTKFAYNNPIYNWRIDDIINFFDIDAWDPILISED